MFALGRAVTQSAAARHSDGGGASAAPASTALISIVIQLSRSSSVSAWQNISLAHTSAPRVPGLQRARWSVSRAAITHRRLAPLLGSRATTPCVCHDAEAQLAPHHVVGNGLYLHNLFDQHEPLPGIWLHRVLATAIATPPLAASRALYRLGPPPWWGRGAHARLASLSPCHVPPCQNSRAHPT